MIAFPATREGSWRRSGKQLEAQAIENARVAQEAAAREKHCETQLPAGRTNTDWTYIPSG